MKKLVLSSAKSYDELHYLQIKAELLELHFTWPHPVITKIQAS
jgi:hypothetical protein